MKRSPVKHKDRVKKRDAATTHGSTSDCTYSIQAAAQQAGVSPHTVRTWESRYGITNPSRTVSGHRRYHRDEVAKLVVLAALVRRGHQISAIATLPLSDLQSLSSIESDKFCVGAPVGSDVGTTDPARRPWGSHQHLPSNVLIQYKKLEGCIDSFDPVALAVGVKWMRTMLGVREFVLQVAIPLFRYVGERVAGGDMDVGREHAFSAVLRDQIGDMLHTLQALSYYEDRQKNSRGKVKVVFATPESDYHEFGILLGASLAVSWSLPLFFAGANLPARNLAYSATSLGAELVVLGNAAVPAAERRMSFKDYLLDLDGQLKDKGHVSIWVGGQGDRPVSRLPSGRKLVYVNSMHDLDIMLGELARS